MEPVARRTHRRRAFPPVTSGTDSMRIRTIIGLLAAASAAVVMMPAAADAAPATPTKQQPYCVMHLSQGNKTTCYSTFTAALSDGTNGKIADAPATAQPSANLDRRHHRRLEAGQRGRWRHCRRHRVLGRRLRQRLPDLHCHRRVRQRQEILGLLQGSHRKRMGQPDLVVPNVRKLPELQLRRRQPDRPVRVERQLQQPQPPGLQLPCRLRLQRPHLIHQLELTKRA
jgi:hypothetical protein